MSEKLEVIILEKEKYVPVAKEYLDTRDDLHVTFVRNYHEYLSEFQKKDYALVIFGTCRPLGIGGVEIQINKDMYLIKKHSVPYIIWDHMGGTVLNKDLLDEYGSWVTAGDKEQSENWKILFESQTIQRVLNVAKAQRKYPHLIIKYV